MSENLRTVHKTSPPAPWPGGVGAVQSQNTAEDCTASHPQESSTQAGLEHRAAAADRSRPQVRLSKLFLAYWSEKSPSCSVSDLQLSWHRVSRWPPPAELIGRSRRRTPPPAQTAPPSPVGSKLLPVCLWPATGVSPEGLVPARTLGNIQCHYYDDDELRFTRSSLSLSPRPTTQ